MSGNPKPTTSGGQMRYSSPYQSMPPTLPSRDSFQLQNTNYVPQQPNQAGSQGAGLRSIAQSGPPNQAPTPPNQDLKVGVPQQTPMNLFQQQNTVRPTQPYNFRPSGPPNQNPRMANNQHRGQQQIYQTNPPTQFVQMPMHSGMYINTMPFLHPGQQRQSFVQQPVILQGQHFQAYSSFPTQIPQTPPTVFPYYTPIPRPGPPPQPTSTPSNTNSTQIPTMPLAQTIVPQPPAARQQKRPRPNALAIIDPATGLNKLDEMYEQDSSHPPSGESSARQTPQPAPHQPNKEIQAMFTKQVAQAAATIASSDEQSYDKDRLSSTGDHIEQPTVYPPPPQQAVHTAKYDHIVQTSTLKAHAKEFVLPISKDPPVVSALCDSEEVTLPSKQQIGRESPSKGRKKESKDHHREPTKETYTPKEVHVVEKQQAPIVTKEEPQRTKETVFQLSPNQPPTKPIEKETDKRKKDSKSDVKPVETIVIEPSNQGNIPQNPVPEQEPPAPVVNAKTKQHASQRKEMQKGNQKSNTSNVPPPQPSKPSSKTSKKNEINNKGASKEGTEMDAYADTVNANLTTPTNNSDVINANTQGVTSITTTPAVNNANANVDAYNKKNESNDTMTIKPVTQVKPTQTKVDVMNVFGGKTVQPVIPHPTDNRDETDRAALANDLIQAKNEVNAAKSANTKDVMEKKSDLPYKKGQWAPHNPQGVKVYDYDFLIAIRSLPITKVKPDTFLNPDCIVDSNSRQLYGFQRMTDKGFKNDLSNPPYQSSYGGKNSSLKGSQSITKHNSLSGNKMNNKGGKSTNNGGTKISISLREDIKLHETENAWKPNRLAKPDSRTEDDKKTEELYRKVRGVLNKLTPQKFDTLVNQIKALEVDTIERLQGVINLTFEKAIDEPNFSVAYAKMCKELSEFMKVITESQEKKEEVNFRKLLINRCQEEFEKQSKDESATLDKEKEINECTDPEKKKVLEFELEEINRRIRMRSVGNIRFIGELFKMQMLTSKIMTTCLDILLNAKDDESLECLCKLLSTIGNELENGSKRDVNSKRDLSRFFNIMQEIVDKKHVKCSSRIRFMLQDVIDLRKNNWVPRRQDLKPKMIDQIQKEAENEQLNQALSNSVPMTPRKDDRRGGDMKGKPRGDDDWTVRGQQKPQQFMVQRDKLKIKTVGTDEPLGGASIFTPWGKGSTYKQPATAFTSNKFALLDSGGMDSMDKMSSGMRGMRENTYNSKGSSLERGSYGKQSYDNRAGSRSGSQHRTNEAPTSIPLRPMAPIIPITPGKPSPPRTPSEPQLSEDQLERIVKNCLDEVINDHSTYEESEVDIRTRVPSNYLRKAVSVGMLHVLEKFDKARIKTGTFFAKLIKVGTLPLEEFCIGLEDVFSQVEDLIIDIPTIWNCLAQFIVPIVLEEVLPLNRLQKSSEVLIGIGLAHKLLASMFRMIVTEKGPNSLKNLWRLSELQFTDFMPADKVDAFIKENQLEFLNGGETTQGDSEFNYEQIETKLLEFFNANTSFDDIDSWITANVGERVKENLFIRTLATAIFKYSIVRVKLDTERLINHYNLFRKYVDNNQTYELQCLYALQSLVHQMEHPQGLCVSIFNKLNEDLIFSQESFIAWEKSEDPAEQEGKGVVLKLLHSFFTQLKENDEEDDYGSTSDEA